MAIAEGVLLGDLVTAGVETRAGLRPSAVDEYAAVLRAGGSLGPGVVFRDGDGTSWLAAGHHRKAAHERAGRDRMECIIREGSRWDAICFGIGNNLRWQGERVTLDDKRFNIKRVLEQQPGMSDAAVAKLVGVSDKTVGKYRCELKNDFGIPMSSQRIGQDGRVYDTSRIGPKLVAVSQSSPVADAMSVDEAPATAGRAGNCQCGAEWTSDGEGGRFCLDCGANHPATPSLPMAPTDEVLPVEPAPEEPAPGEPAKDAGRLLTASCPLAAKPGDGERLYESVTQRLGYACRAADALGNVWPGPAHQRTMEAFDEVGRRLEGWREYENNPPVDEQAPLEGCEEWCEAGQRG